MIAADGHWVEARRLRELLALRGVSQAEVARRMGVKPQTVTDLFKRDSNPHWPTVEKLARVLRVRPQDLSSRGRPIDDIAAGEGVTPGKAGDAQHEVTRARPTGGYLPYWGMVPCPRDSLRHRGASVLPATMAEVAEFAVVVETTVDVADFEGELRFRRGALLIVEREATWTDGRFHVFTLGEETVVRQVCVRQNMLHWTDPSGERVTRPASLVELFGVVIRGYLELPAT